MKTNKITLFLGGKHQDLEAASYITGDKTEGYGFFLGVLKDQRETICSVEVWGAYKTKLEAEKARKKALENLEEIL